MEKICNKSSSKKFKGPNYDNALWVAISQYGTKQWDKVGSLLDVHPKYCETRYKRTMKFVAMYEYRKQLNESQCSDHMSSCSPRISVREENEDKGNSKEREVRNDNPLQNWNQVSIRISRFTVDKVNEEL